jgi:formylmethanofuran dehydrogenase subunit B
MTPQLTQGSIDAAKHFVCPFCGLLCDDLPGPGEGVDISAWIGRLQALCPRAGAGIEAVLRSGSSSATSASIDGRPVSVDAAVAEAGRRILAARRPVIGGLGGDVQAARAALALGDLVGARLLHRNQFAAQRNLFAVQSRGAVTTTLAEVRQRAEMVVLVGSDVTRNFPRLLERLFAANPAFVAAARRRLVLLGAPPPSRLPAGIAAEGVDCGGLDLFDSVAALRACLRGQLLPAHAGKIEALSQLAARMADCRYGAIIWAAADLEMPGADLLVEQLHQLVIDLNRRTRWAALPLAGNDGDLSANAVATWQTGFPLPVEFAASGVSYDPFPDYADADLLLWLAALPGVAPAQVPGVRTDTPQIVIAAPAWAGQLSSSHVFIPAATPGITGCGHLVRTDGVITLYAPAACASTLPPASLVMDRIASAAAGVAP